MADQSFDRTIINARERPLSSDINQMESQLDRTLRDLLATMLVGRASDSSDSPLAAPISGFFGDAFKVRPTVVPGMSVRIAAGLGMLDNNSDVLSNINSISNLNDLSRYKPLSLLAEHTFSGIPAPSVNPRIDIIEVRMNRVVGNPLSRDILNTGTGVFDPTSVNKTLSYTLDGSSGTVTSPSDSTAAIGYKRGVEAASPAVPATTSGYVKIAEIRLSVAQATITRTHVKDLRRLLAPYNIAHVSAQFSVASGTGAITAQQIIAPPGIEVVCRKLAAPAQNYLGFYIIGGLFDANSRVVAVTTPGLSALDTNLIVARGGGIASASGLSAGDVTALNDATLAGPATLFAEGQPYAAALFYYLRQSAGTTDATLPDPFIVQFDATIRR